MEAVVLTLEQGKAHSVKEGHMSNIPSASRLPRLIDPDIASLVSRNPRDTRRRIRPITAVSLTNHRSRQLLLVAATPRFS
jgi:hypothetical protein